jgi:hypothetical protein
VSNIVVYKYYINIKQKYIFKILFKINLKVNFFFDSVVSVTGLNLGRAMHGLAARSPVVLSHCLQLKSKAILDVGSGDGERVAPFGNLGTKETCVNFGTIIYVQRANTTPGGQVIYAIPLHTSP